MIHFADWLPTLLALAGKDPTALSNLDGENVLPALRGEGAVVSSRRFWQWNRYTPVYTCNAAMRDGPWKLVRPAIREAMWVAPADLEMDRRLKYEPDGVADIDHGPEPARAVPPPPPPMLFQIEEDPFEERDLAAIHPERTAAMARQIDDFYAALEAERRSITR